jgi:hypothetical protein
MDTDGEMATQQVMPEALRAVAEKNLAQTRELYARSKKALEAMLDSWEKTFGTAGQGAAALNRKVMDMTDRNINCGFDFAKSLASAKTVAEAMHLHSMYWRDQLTTLEQQAQEVRELSSRITAGHGGAG